MSRVLVLFYSDYVGKSVSFTELDDEPNFDALKKMLGYRVTGIESVVGYDWEKDHSENSNSLNVNHEAISYPEGNYLPLLKVKSLK